MAGTGRESFDNADKITQIVDNRARTRYANKSSWGNRLKYGEMRTIWRDAVQDIEGCLHVKGECYYGNNQSNRKNDSKSSG